MEDGTESGLRLVRRWKVLLAHDATAATCNLLLDAIGGALGNVDVAESSSVDHALTTAQPGRYEVALVCLDLPPAPLGGVRLAEALVARGLPVILVTRSLRWIPEGAVSLRDLPWIPPDADVGDVSRAVREAMSALARPPATLPPAPRSYAGLAQGEVRRARTADGAE